MLIQDEPCIPSCDIGAFQTARTLQEMGTVQLKGEEIDSTEILSL
jgi:hypothetical protein